MRIWFTLNISAVISAADVSWNGLFIGIWTTLEVSLVFIVACTLCLPKLIQSKGKKMKTALSTPFTAIPNIIRRKTNPQDGLDRNSTLSGQTVVSNSTWEDIELDDKGSKYFDEREHNHWQEEADSRTRKPSRTLDRTSSSAASSGYSQRKAARHSGNHQDGFQLQPLHTPEFSRHQQQWKSAFSP